MQVLPLSEACFIVFQIQAAISGGQHSHFDFYFHKIKVLDFRITRYDGLEYTRNRYFFYSSNHCQKIIRLSLWITIYSNNLDTWISQLLFFSLRELRFIAPLQQQSANSFCGQNGFCGHKSTTCLANPACWKHILTGLFKAESSIRSQRRSCQCSNFPWC